MKQKMRKIKAYVIQSLALSMIATLWMLYIDAKFYGTENIFKVIFSITIFTGLFCFLERVMYKWLENHFVLYIGMEFLVLVGLFYVFGKYLNWFVTGKEWLILVYVIPVYIVGYFFRLIGIQKEAEEINKHLEARKVRMKKRPRL